jgi:hypothetical protein
MDSKQYRPIVWNPFLSVTGGDYATHANTDPYLINALHYGSYRQIPQWVQRRPVITSQTGTDRPNQHGTADREVRCVRISRSKGNVSKITVSTLKYIKGKVCPRRDHEVPEGE